MKLRNYTLFICCTLSSIAYASSFLIFGATGWIGGKIITLLEGEKHTIFKAVSRLEERVAVAQELDDTCPDFVINAAGVTGRPNVDWCEDHKQATIRANLIGALMLADLCFERGIHLTNFGTGCIYEYDNTHPVYSGCGFTEEDKPNFMGSFYSRTKIMLDALLQEYPNVLNLRIRMPISDDLHERNFITKITKYKKVVNIPNSMSVLSDLLPIAIDMTKKRIKGIYNFVNPGVISHNEILELYKEYIDPFFKYENFDLDEHDKILKARRSNNELNVDKLLTLYPDLLPIKKSIKLVFERMQNAAFDSKD